MSERTSRAPAIAIGVAATALVTSLIAVVVVATRSPSGAATVAPAEARVAAAELAKLERDAVESAIADGKVIGVKVTDTKLRAALGLEPADVITNLAGRPIKRDSDVNEAIAGAGAMDAVVVHVEVLRDGQPVYLRWQIDGDLRGARRRDSVGGTPDPSRDPLFDTVKRIDEFHFEVPRATLDRIAANPTDFIKGARVVPSIGSGVPDGFKLYAIRPSSMFAAIGLKNGDTVRAINGLETTSIDKLLEVYSKVRDAKELAIDITRRGKYELITISVK